LPPGAEFFAWIEDATPGTISLTATDSSSNIIANDQSSSPFTPGLPALVATTGTQGEIRICVSNSVLCDGSSGPSTLYSLFIAVQPVPPPISLELSPTSIDFGGIAMGALSAPQLVTITNVTEDIPGPFSLLIGSIALTGVDTGDFVLHNDFCSGQNLEIGGSCTFEVVISPTITGVKRATLSIPSNDLDMPVVGMPLSGEGLGTIPVNYLLTFAKQRPASLTFELHTDRECTSAVHTETISINDPNLLIELVVVNLGGARVRKSFNLNFVLTDVVPQDAFFLEVIGTGVSGIRHDCQPQPLFFSQK